MIRFIFHYVFTMMEFSLSISDSVTSIYSWNLSVINYPDSAGSACDFSPLVFTWEEMETYWGLPNNPEYDLGALDGSPC
ncbi:MAG: hypothetical protein IPP71_09230 [Bacteroidetes bacterium]|nr:hypothetical protein [Bacteroidota bacterium]